MRMALLVLAVSLAPPAAAAPAKSITLQRVAGKTPTAVPAALVSHVGGAPVAVVVRDARSGPDPSVVGSQQEKGVLLYEWRSAQPVADSMRVMVERTLEAWNVPVAPNSPAQLELTIRDLRIDEVPQTFGSSYHASVELQGGIFDPEGMSTRLGRVVTGTAKRSGTDRRAKPCNEALTGALEDALAKLLVLSEPAQATGPLAADAADPNAVEPKVMLRELVRLKDAGVGEPVLLGYVRQRRLSAPLTADDILAWKESGLPESVIHAAQEVK